MIQRERKVLKHGHVPVGPVKKMLVLTVVRFRRAVILKKYGCRKYFIRVLDAF